MLYLAEVQRKSGVFGGGKAEFRLIAAQRSEQNWSAVPGDEILPAPDDATYGDGALVMVELSGNRQVQRHYEAGRPLVNILQNFSSLSKKFKSQEEEIEQWKQSLTFQSQALNQREMELETRQEEVEQAEADLEKLEAQKAEIEAARADVDALRQEYERKNSELEGAWAHLNGELQKFEERQSDFQTQAGLDSDQTQRLYDSLGRLTSTVLPMDDLRHQIGTIGDLTQQQQQTLTELWQALERSRQEADGQAAAVTEQTAAVDQAWQSWQSLYAETLELKAAIRQQQAQLDAKLGESQALSDQMQQQRALYKQIYALLNTGDQVRLSKRVDVAGLEAMPVETLQNLVSDLEKDLEKMSRFVSDQEEELKFQQEAIDEVKGKMEAATEFERLQLETEMAEEQDRYRMLNETLVGQRRNLMEREEILEQHRAVLLRRQGHATEDEVVSSTDVEPILNQIDETRQQLEAKIQALNEEIAALQGKLDGARPQAEEKTAALEQQREAIRAAQSALVDRQLVLARTQQTISQFESFLQPVQDRVDASRAALERLQALMAQFQESNDYQLQAISEMQQTVQGLAADPVALAS